MTPDEVQRVKFRNPRIGKSGYDMDAVDRLLDRIAATLRGESRITRNELAGMTLSRPPRGKRGYRQEDVDAFFARVAAEWPTA